MNLAELMSFQHTASDQEPMPRSGYSLPRPTLGGLAARIGPMVRGFGNESVPFGLLPHAAAVPMMNYNRTIGKLTGDPQMSYADALAAAKGVLGEDETNYGGAAMMGSLAALIPSAPKKVATETLEHINSYQKRLADLGFLPHESGYLIRQADEAKGIPMGVASSKPLSSRVPTKGGISMYDIHPNWETYVEKMNNNNKLLVFNLHDPAAKYAAAHIMKLAEANKVKLTAKHDPDILVLFDPKNAPNQKTLSNIIGD